MLDARLLHLENRALKYELAAARRALVYQRQRADYAERQVAALRDAQARAWRVSLAVTTTDRRPRTTDPSV